MNRLIKTILCSLFLLASCSRVDLALNWADTLLYYEIKNQFDFKGSQKATVEKSTDQFVAELKKQWIPPVGEQLKMLAEAIETLPNDAIRKRFQKEAVLINNHLKSLLLKVSDQVDAISQIITEENWKQFNENFEEKNKEVLSEKPKLRLVKNIKLFTGDLTSAQEEKVVRWENENAFSRELRIQNRRHICKQLNDKLKPWSKENWNEAMKSFLMNPDSFQLDAYKDQVKSRTASLVELISDIVLSMNSKQKKELKKNLLSWSEKLAQGALN